MTVRTRLEAELSLRVTAPGRLALSVVVANSARADSEELTVRTAGGQNPPVDPPAELPHGTRVHVLDLPSDEVHIRYRAERVCGDSEPEALTDADQITYTRPSRYCPSDRMIGLALEHFSQISEQRDQVREIVRYVSGRLVYIPGTSRPTDSALETLLAGEGVCRDFAHLGITYCRALDIPARFAAVYAPGLSPMDFHAVFEAAIDGHWYVFDATRLAPRQTLTRIATGRDATDTAFLSTLGCEIELLRSSATATTAADLPEDDGSALVALA